MSQAQLKTVTPITWGVELITPEDAAYHLKVNINNRGLRKGVVANYASEMRSGNWDVNGQDIIFSDVGRLLDGQHRLSAVIEAGVPVLMGVKRGVPTSNFATLDAGATRTAKDVVGMAGLANASVVAAAARLALLYAKGMDLNSSVPKTEVARFCIENPVLEEVASQAKSAAKASRLNGGPLAAVVFLANRKGTYKTEMHAFLEGISTGANLNIGDPRLTLKNWGARARDNTGQSLTARHGFAAIARCWTAYMSGEELTVIKSPKTFTPTFMRIAGYEPF